MSTSVDNDLDLLAPKFGAAVTVALKEANKAGFDAVVFEAFRSDVRQRFLYQKGRTIIPPKTPVTNAPTADFSWHGYGLAIDVVHRTKFWEPDGGFDWFRNVAKIFKAYNCKWGGDWTSIDPPHFQWHLCKPSPSDAARQLKRSKGHQAVWDAVQAS
jgi:peptidoglycan L-alanyl-D-glutamate endopeptidase CwlK